MASYQYGQHPVDDVGQALGARPELVGQCRVARVVDLAELVVVVDARAAARRTTGARA